MKQLRSLTELLQYAQEVGPLTISVACAEDAEVLEAVEEKDERRARERPTSKR